MRASSFDTAEIILLENRREKRGCHAIAMTDDWVHFHVRSKFLGSCEAKTLFLWGLSPIGPSIYLGYILLSLAERRKGQICAWRRVVPNRGRLRSRKVWWQSGLLPAPTESRTCMANKEPRALRRCFQMRRTQLC